jgi:nitroreductase
MDENKTLDEIILSRRTCRTFNQEIPSRQQVEQILKAGLHAPYAALASAGNKKYRQFVVVNSQSEKLDLIKDILKSHTKKLGRLLSLFNAIIFWKKISDTFKNRLHSDLMGNAPYYIFVIEPKGFPPAVKQSIAHCMQNMWLKATELGLGFRLISVFESMGKNKKLCELLSIEKGEYSINCCAVGYPSQKLEKSIRPKLDEVSSWI